MFKLLNELVQYNIHDVLWKHLQNIEMNVMNMQYPKTFKK
jgi:hypothetical protein